MGNRVLVAMSGGVDSSVTAAVLHDRGYAVEGVTLRLFDNEDVMFEGASCCSTSDVDDARQVCLDLGVPHYVYNFTRTFNADVIDRFCESYLEGLTPNPCIDCNRYVKFSAMMQRRSELGYDYVATGHYARIRYNEESGRHELACGRDANKDQSYVLYHLKQDELAHMLFPLGEFTKQEVRALAASKGFLNASKAESQDICFVPDGDYAGFILQRTGRRFEAGEIVDRNGNVLGRHNGLVHYTIGQRKGIGVAAREPLYVYAKDIESNRLVVDIDERTLCTKVIVDDVNFIARERLEHPERFLVKCHYRQKARPALVEQLDDDSVRLTFEEPQRACAPGQSAVIYEGDAVVCGGTIRESI